ncbi:hypothetical protein BpHYR1_009475 [Brachionus plicatilis]|uniref:Uncharacterized protein n=1 Tax=Brachionus plicatilis TaxID=10195 RepID=A0A3M7S036_BRAPC|nr:hypothetical protein BpHYR1_009475 [Brachionus plicatilis]
MIGIRHFDFFPLWQELVLIQRTVDLLMLKDFVMKPFQIVVLMLKNCLYLSTIEQSKRKLVYFVIRIELKMSNNLEKSSIKLLVDSLGSASSSFK